MQYFALHCIVRSAKLRSYAPPSLLAYSSSMFSSYNLSAALDASDGVCEMPAFASSLAEPLLESIAEETLLVTDSASIEVSLLEGLSLLVREGREGMLKVAGDGAFDWVC